LCREGYKFEVIEINEIIELEDVEWFRVRRLLTSLRSDKLLMKPLIIEEFKKFIIDGHHRFKALKLLGVKEVPVFLARYGTDIEDVGGWVYIANDDIKSYLNELVRVIDELKSLTKRGPDPLVLNIGRDQVKVSIDRVDLYIALKYVDIPLTKVPQGSRLTSTVSLILPKLTPEDLYLLISKCVKLPPRMTYHKTYLKHITIPYPISKLLRC
jgi:hypothetical protein